MHKKIQKDVWLQNKDLINTQQELVRKYSRQKSPIYRGNRNIKCLEINLTKKCARLNEEIHKITVIHKKMILPNEDTSIFVDGKFHYYKNVNFLKINFKFKAISIRIPSVFF